MKINFLILLLLLIVGSISFYLNLDFIDIILIYLSVIILLITIIVKYRWKIYYTLEDKFVKKIKSDTINNYLNEQQLLHEIKQSCLKIDDWLYYH